MLQDINPWKSPGLDDIPPSILRTYHDSLAASVTALINESLCTGDFPAPFKFVHVCPILKKGDSTWASNYRPISLLPVVSKVLKQVVYEQLQAYIKTRPAILPTLQFAYREGHSCKDALSLCVNRWQRAMDRGDTVAVAFLDLSKAFDCVRRDILLVELFNCGLGHTVLKWFLSRSQAASNLHPFYTGSNLLVHSGGSPRLCPRSSPLLPYILTDCLLNSALQPSNSMPMIPH